MARKENSLNPEDGPIQAFAWELRELRRAGGNPTYRAMAARAGFSQTTLSSAAAGRRIPSLDVVLAYIGVCGGNSDEWRLKWTRLNSLTVTTQTGTSHVEDALSMRRLSALPLESSSAGQPVSKLLRTHWRRLSAVKRVAASITVIVHCDNHTCIQGNDKHGGPHNT